MYPPKDFDVDASQLLPHLSAMNNANMQHIIVEWTCPKCGERPGIELDRLPTGELMVPPALIHDADEGCGFMVGLFQHKFTAFGVTVQSDPPGTDGYAVRPHSSN